MIKAVKVPEDIGTAAANTSFAIIIIAHFSTIISVKLPSYLKHNLVRAEVGMIVQYIVRSI